MRILFLLVFILFVGCNKSRTTEEVSQNESSTQSSIDSATRSSETSAGSTVTRSSDSSAASVEAEEGFALDSNLPKLYPIDEAKKDPSFLEFRNALKAAVSKRDKEYLISIADSAIRWSFGNGGGVKSFVEHWQLDTPTSAKANSFWSLFSQVLEMGGAWSTQAPGSFWAPYVYSSWPETGNYDPFEHAAITSKDIPVYKSNNAASTVIGRLSYDIVKVLDRGHLEEAKPHSSTTFVKVKSYNGIVGYVTKDHLWSPIDYRAGFMKKQGKWKLSAFIAGD